MGGDSVKLINHTTGDVVDSDAWMDSVVDIGDLNRLAHHFFWNTSDKLISNRNSVAWFKHTYNSETKQMVTEYVGDNYFKLQPDDVGPIPAETQGIKYNYDGEANGQASENTVKVTKFYNDKKYVIKQTLQSSADHYPTWVNFGNRKVCLNCLEDQVATMTLSQTYTYSYSFTAKPEVTAANLDAKLDHDPPVILAGQAVNSAVERRHYLIIAAFDHLLAQHKRSFNRDPALAKLVQDFIDKYTASAPCTIPTNALETLNTATVANKRLYQNLLIELMVWLGGGDDNHC